VGQSEMTLDSNQFFDWCVGVLVLVFAAGGAKF
jgi:hypothetical protein